MHRCLQIHDILALIFAEIDGHVFDSRVVVPPRIVHRDVSMLRTLAGLARTCVAFHEPALDVLWREIPDLYVLVYNLMPAELLSYDDSRRHLTLLREAEAATWERLYPYVRRIRAVGIPTRPSGVPSRTLDAETILRPLEAFLQRHAVEPKIPIPYLNHLEYHPFWTDEHYSRILLHPRLEVLYLPTMVFSPYWTESHLKDEVYNTQNLFSLLEQLTPHIRPALCRLECLRTLWVKATLLDADSLLHLSLLPTLTSLGLENGWSGVRYRRRSVMQDRAFPSLKELLVSIAHGDAPAFLGHIDPSFLDAVTVYWEYLYSHVRSSGDVLESILMTLGKLRHQPCHVRVVLDKTMEGMIHCPNPRHTLQPLPGSAEFLEPILFFTCLCTLEVSIDVVFQLDNDFISKIAQHLPNLESLALVPLLKTEFSLVRFQQEERETNHEDPGIGTRDTDGGVRRMLPTFDGLVLLVHGCPRLSTLKVAVESTIVASDAISCASRDGSRVRHMELWATGLDPRLPDAAFHKFFTAYFPLLDYLDVVLPIEPHSQSELVPAVRDDLTSVPISRDQARARWDAILREMPLRTSV